MKIIDTPKLIFKLDISPHVFQFDRNNTHVTLFLGKDEFYFCFEKQTKCIHRLRNVIL